MHDRVELPLTDRERFVFSYGIGQWGGPTRPDDRLARYFGFVVVAEFDEACERLWAEVGRGGPMTLADWRLALDLFAVVFASDSVGASSDWDAVAPYTRIETVETLRAIRVKLVALQPSRPLVGDVGRRPVVTTQPHDVDDPRAQDELLRAGVAFWATTPTARRSDAIFFGFDDVEALRDEARRVTALPSLVPRGRPVSPEDEWALVATEFAVIRDRLDSSAHDAASSTETDEATVRALLRVRAAHAAARPARTAGVRPPEAKAHTALAVHLQRCAAQLVTRNQLRDRFDLARTVTHTADFPRRAAAERAADELRTSGYDVTVTRRGLLGASLEASREDALDDDRAVTFTREVFDVVQRAGGRYDGWSAEVIAEAQA